MNNEAVKEERPGFFASVYLAFKIVKGSVRLLRLHPQLVVPMLPVCVLVLFISIFLSFATTARESLIIFMAITVAAVGMLISFGIISQIILQLHNGRLPSLQDAAFSHDMIRMIPRILGLSAVWYSIVLILVFIEMIIRTLLDRISEDLGDSVINAIFGTIGAALRMAAFMVVVIMTFEDVGLRPAFQRLQAVAKNRALASVGGLVLTRLASLLVGLILIGAAWLLDSFALGSWSYLLLVPPLAVGWLICIYLEQLFVTGLYLYSTLPDSPLVEILLGDVLGGRCWSPEWLPEPQPRLP